MQGLQSSWPSQTPSSLLDNVTGFQLAKADVIRVVHVGESTLDKRVAEFADTAAGALTVVEFEDRSRQIEDEEQLQIDAMEPLPALPAPDGPVTHGCEHLSTLPYLASALHLTALLQCGGQGCAPCMMIARLQRLHVSQGPSRRVWPCLRTACARSATWSSSR